MKVTWRWVFFSGLNFTTVVCITAMINHVFVSFSAVQISDLSYIHLHSSPSTGILWIHKSCAMIGYLSRWYPSSRLTSEHNRGAQPSARNRATFSWRLFTRLLPAGAPSSQAKQVKEGAFVRARKVGVISREVCKEFEYVTGNYMLK